MDQLNYHDAAPDQAIKPSLLQALIDDGVTRIDLLAYEPTRGEIKFAPVPAVAGARQYATGPASEMGDLPACCDCEAPVTTPSHARRLEYLLVRCGKCEWEKKRRETEDFGTGGRELAERLAAEAGVKVAAELVGRRVGLSHFKEAI